MDKMHIAVFVGMALETDGQVSTGVVQKFIKNHPSSGSVVSPDDIKETLDLLVTAGFLELDKDEEFQSIYKRYIPIHYEQSKIIQ